MNLVLCSAAGDRGFDPLRLGEGSPEKLNWYKEGELYNGRWAMMAVVGILFTDALGLPKFWLAGAEVCLLLQSGFAKWRSPIPHSRGVCL